jgi:hypothetical protein
VLSMITNVATAADVCAGSGAGAVLPPGAGAVTASGRGVIAFARPRAVWAADVFGQGRNAAGQDGAAGRDQVPCRRNPIEQYPHMTRIAAASSGGLGPYPARDPV